MIETVKTIAILVCEQITSYLFKNENVEKLCVQTNDWS